MDEELRTPDNPSRTDDSPPLRRNPDEGRVAEPSQPEPSTAAGRHRDPQSDQRWRHSIMLLVALTLAGAAAIGARSFLPNPIDPTAQPSTPSTSASATTSPATSPETSPVGRVAIITAVEDGTVDADRPDRTAGDNPALRVDGSPQAVTYLKFRVDDVGARITRTVLMIYSTTGSPDGFTVSTVDTSGWDESTITFTNAPPIGEPIGSSGSFRAEAVIQVELERFIVGPGFYTIALSTSSETRIGFASTESNDTKPQLLIRSEQS